MYISILLFLCPLCVCIYIYAKTLIKTKKQQQTTNKHYERFCAVGPLLPGQCFFLTPKPTHLLRNVRTLSFISTQVYYTYTVTADYNSKT